MTTMPFADEQASALKCPSCEHSLERTNRSRLMRLLIGSKRYYCWSCHRDYLYFLGYFISLH